MVKLQNGIHLIWMPFFLTMMNEMIIGLANLQHVDRNKVVKMLE